jgi:hypothetical protein
MTNRSITLLRVELAPPDDDQINCARLGHPINTILFLRAALLDRIGARFRDQIKCQEKNNDFGMTSRWITPIRVELCERLLLWDTKPTGWFDDVPAAEAVTASPNQNTAAAHVPRHHEVQPQRVGARRRPRQLSSRTRTNRAAADAPPSARLVCGSGAAAAQSARRYRFPPLRVLPCAVTSPAPPHLPCIYATLVPRPSHQRPNHIDPHTNHAREKKREKKG